MLAVQANTNQATAAKKAVWSGIMRRPEGLTTSATLQLSATHLSPKHGRRKASYVTDYVCEHIRRGPRLVLARQSSLVYLSSSSDLEDESRTTRASLRYAASIIQVKMMHILTMLLLLQFLPTAVR